MFEGIVSFTIFFISLVFYAGITYSFIRLNGKTLEEVKIQINEINKTIMCLIERISKIETIIENKLNGDCGEK